MTSHHAESTQPRPRATQGDRVAAWVMWIEVVAILGVLVFYVVETLRGETDDVVRSVMSMVTIALLGLFVATVGRFLGRGRLGARMPTLVWNFMLLPVGFDLVRGGQAVWGLPILALAIVAMVGVVIGMRARPGV